MDGIIATANDEDFLLPAAPNPKYFDDCKDCAIKQCWEKHLECNKDEDCKTLLECKSKGNSPVKLFCCDYDNEIDGEARKKYQDYFDCVFSSENACNSKCKTGSYFGCVKNTKPECPDENDDGDEIDEIELTIHINDIRDMRPGSKRMYSPGEHCVCVKWVRSADKDPEICSIEDQKECYNGNAIETSSKTIGYTNGLGEVTLTIPLENADSIKRAEGYLRIERGIYGKNDEFPTEDDLGPFIYYFGRFLNESQDVTLYLPRKGQEEKWIDVVPDSDIWSFKTGGIITALAFDCSVTPASGATFTFPGLAKNDNDIYTIGNYSYISKQLYWRSIESELGFEMTYNPKSTNQFPGIGSFYFSINDPVSSESKTNVDITTTFNNQADEKYRTYNIQIQNGSTTFIVMYPE